MGRSIDGLALKKLRESRGLTQDALAKKIDVSKRTIVRMENGESVTRTSIRKVAEALGVTESALYDVGTVAAPASAGPATWPAGSRQHRLRHYLRTLSEQLGRVHPIVADHAREEKPLRLADLYVVPQLAEREVGSEMESDDLAEAGKPLIETLAAQTRLALLAPGGMGKSTLVAWLVDQLADPAPNEVRAALGDLLPVPLVLRDLAGVPEKPTWNDLVKAYRESRLGENLSDADWAEVEKALEAGEAYVFLDGLDEVGSGTRRQDFVNAFWEGVDRYPKARWLATSRIVGYDEAEVDPALPEPANTKRSRAKREDEGPEAAAIPSTVSRTEAKRARDFVRCWLVPFDDARINAFAENWYELREEADVAAARAADLTAAVRRHPDTLQLARVPYFLALMGVVHRQYASLPNGRIELYKRIVAGCWSAIPRRKQMSVLPYSDLDLLAWFGEVGFAMQRARGENEGLVALSGSRVRETLAGAALRRGAALDDEELDRVVDFLKYRAGLLVEASPGQFRFSHLLLQEFFAAWHLGNTVERRSWWGDRQDSFTKDDLRHWADSPHWAETLFLFFERLAFAPDPQLPDDMADIVFPGWSETRRRKLGEAAIRLLQRLATDDAVRWFDADFRKRATGAVTLWWVEQKRGGVPLAMLKHLDLDGTGVSDATPLGGLAKLEYLNLSGTGVSDATPLGGLAKLEVLDLRGTGVSDATPLGGFANLEVLDLSGTRVSDATPLGGLANLKHLYLSGTGVSDATPLGGLANLETLYLDGTGVSDASVAALKRVRRKLSIYT